MATILDLLNAGWMSLLDYLAAHVLLCLVPAFFIAGYLSGVMPRQTVTRYLGPQTPRYISYPAAAIGGFVLAVCSCTILPLFAGIWKRGAGLGPAITFLFVGPAINILAISYTGAAIGMDIAVARVVLAVTFGIVIGLIMASLFRQRTAQPVTSAGFAGQAGMKPAQWALFGLLLAVLIAGTLQVDLLNDSWVRLTIAGETPGQATLDSLHLTAQGALLIVMLVLIAPAAWRGMSDVLNGFNRWTWATLAMVAVTLLIAAPATESGSIVIKFTGRFFAELALVVAIGTILVRHIERDDLAQWLWETWRFVKAIFPLLIVGVFFAGVFRHITPETWVESLAGSNTVWANLVGVVFGVFMYFPTLVEVPMAAAFLDLGMHRGPLLAYLLADPELSLQSILVTGKILGRRKTIVYVLLVTVFSTLAGLLFGLVV